MIVRILGEGQFRVDDETAARLTALDKELDASVSEPVAPPRPPATDGLER